MSVLIIAEAGVNHNGDIGLARQLVDLAAEAGADAVKFQTFSADRLVASHAAKAAYQQRTGDAGETQHQMLRRLELNRDMHEALLDHCRTRSIRFLSTPFDIPSVDLLVDLGVGLFKVSSGEIDNLPLLRHIGRQGKPVIISTGMATLGEIEQAIAVLEQSGTPRSRTTVLHCTTEYPTALADVNLKAMLTIRDALSVAVGYSDHTLGIAVPIAAAALGACVIEKHFTIDRTLPGPDHQASLEPAELKEMVRGVRAVELALGDGIKRPCASEAKNKIVARKSIVAAVAIQAGEPLTEMNLAVKRPGTGVSPMRWDELIGRRASRNFLPDDPIDF